MTTVKERLITFKNNLVTAKSNLASAITAKGVTAAGTDSFDSFVTKVNSIPSIDYDLYAIRGYKFYNAEKVGDLTITNGTGTTMTTDTNYSKEFLEDDNLSNSNSFIITPPEIEDYTDAVLLDFILGLNITNNTTSYDNYSNYGIITYLPPTDSSTFDSIVQTREVTINYTLTMEFIYAVTSEGNGMSGETASGSKAYIEGIGTKDTIIHINIPFDTYEWMQKMYLFNGTFAYKKA
jgi:hypothetical protein